MSSDPADHPKRFLRELESATLTGQFRHQDHVLAAWLMLKEGPLEEVLGRYSRAIRRLAVSRGADGLYHQTITWTYLFAIRERMASMDPDHDWATFRHTHPELFQDHRRFLRRYFTDEVLDSELARQTFVLPDRGSIQPGRC